MSLNRFRPSWTMTERDEERMLTEARRTLLCHDVLIKTLRGLCAVLAVD